MSKITNPYKGIKGKLINRPEPEDMAEHFYPCSICGQLIDRRDLGQVIHHLEPNHEKIDFDA